MTSGFVSGLPRNGRSDAISNGWTCSKKHRDGVYWRSWLTMGPWGALCGESDQAPSAISSHLPNWRYIQWTALLTHTNLGNDLKWKPFEIPSMEKNLCNWCCLREMTGPWDIEGYWMWVRRLCATSFPRVVFMRSYQNVSTVQPAHIVHIYSNNPPLD